MPSPYLLELFKTGLACLTLAVGWVFGQRIIAHWDVRKKRQELDIATASEFHHLYGEFKEVSRLWRGFKYDGADKKVVFDETIPFELLKRATAAEGGIEAIMVKLSSERRLDDKDIETLGLFRQAFQQLRDKIRRDQRMDWVAGTAEYELFNDLAIKTAGIISHNRWPKSWQRAGSSEVLHRITAIRPSEWDVALSDKEIRKRVRKPGSVPQSFRAGAGAVILNQQGQVLALERSKISNAWQMPQGGLEVHEEPIDAVYREIKEETNISKTDLKLLGAYPGPLSYELPPEKRSEKTGRGQTQFWFLFRFCGSDDTIDLKNGGEFRTWKWMLFSELLTSVVYFRRPVYERISEYFHEHLAKAD